MVITWEFLYILWFILVVEKKKFVEEVVGSNSIFGIS